MESYTGIAIFKWHWRLERISRTFGEAKPGLSSQYIIQSSMLKFADIHKS